ncbi:MoaC family protein [Emericellopsis atlantica]|uniref:cyclic pyranopterin monophosphate synthase n=1 Tax=Emericellopsis atlantica TaxID=2614577 RepID=A0A9P7ZNB7_9HYPO|nr:MoaC family protein [Emericellopsis atlantica]KAG9254882.1 MoaC family protein [Emericellopsis atlantica]
MPPRVPRSPFLPLGRTCSARHPQQQQQQHRFFTASPRVRKDDDEKSRLTHVNPSGAAHMVSISSKQPTSRTAVAACAVHFSKPTVLPLIGANSLTKGDVLSVARIAGIMAAKRTPDLIPLCHPIPISHVSVDLDLRPGEEGTEKKDRVEIRATVSCDGKTGVEMEALTAASTAALTVYDMCKAVDKGMRVEGLRVVLKEGGKSGRWEME